MKSITYSDFDASNRSVNVALKFEEPFELGLNIDTPDYVYYFVNQTYDWTKVLTQQPTADGLYDGKRL